MTTDLDLRKYFSRIGYDGPIDADLSTLSMLQAKHISTIPFEGIDPLLKRPVKLDLASLQAKLVDQRRGGYCFEQNILFKAVLDTVGFATTGLTARVRWMSPPESELGPREHMLIRVDLPEGPYLVDVGFGACLLDAPLKLQSGFEQKTAMGTFILSESNGQYTLSARQPSGFRVAYVFDLHPQIQADYELGSWYTSTSPSVPFASLLIMERLAADKRYKLINTNLVIEGRDGEVLEQRALTDLASFVKVLDDLFGVDLGVDAANVFDRIIPNPEAASN